MYTDTVPTTAPANLEGIVDPVYAETGVVRDWRLHAGSGAEPLTAGQIARYRAWRGDFACEWFVGERAFIHAFLTWARERSPVTALDVLAWHDARVDFHHALQMRLQADQARRAVDVSAATGLGLYTGQRSGALARAVVPGESPVPLLSTVGASVRVGREGLLLRHRGAAGELVLTGWQFHDAGVTLTAPDGQITTDDPRVQRVLRVLGRQASQVDVRVCPLSTLVAPFLVFISDAAAMAGDTGSDLYVRAGWT